jgi:hypothetical protein
MESLAEPLDLRGFLVQALMQLVKAEKGFDLAEQLFRIERAEHIDVGSILETRLAGSRRRIGE